MSFKVRGWNSSFLFHKRNVAFCTDVEVMPAFSSAFLDTVLFTEFIFVCSLIVDTAVFTTSTFWFSYETVNTIGVLSMTYPAGAFVSTSL